MMWVYLSKTQRNPTTPNKFALGILQLGLGFLVFAMSAQYMDAAGRTPFMFLNDWLFIINNWGIIPSLLLGLVNVTELITKKHDSLYDGSVFFILILCSLIFQVAIAKLTTLK